MNPLQALRIAAGVEFATLVVLLTNLATVHWPAVSSVVGPTHGCAYMFVVILTVRQSHAARTRATASNRGLGELSTASGHSPTRVARSDTDLLRS